MAKNKNTSNKTINILIAACTVAIIALAILVTVAVTGSREVDMTKKIAKLDITENPVVTIEMENGGIIKAELYPEIAPNTVCNFIELANSGYYDGLIFHRCIEGFMIQGGDPQGTGAGGPGYTIKGEFTNNGFQNNLKHERGVISTARQGENPYTGEKNHDTAGSQFFIMVEDYPSLDGDYASFGKVIEGMDVVDEIVAIETDENDKPLVDQVIKSIKVDTKGIKYPESQKIE